MEKEEKANNFNYKLAEHHEKMICCLTEPNFIDFFL